MRRCINSTLSKCYEDDDMENEIVGACRAHGGDCKSVQNLDWKVSREDTTRKNLAQMGGLY
jgi:hypothetical protein